MIGSEIENSKENKQDSSMTLLFITEIRYSTKKKQKTILPGLTLLNSI